MRYFFTFLRLLWHAFMNPHQLCKAIGTHWAEYLASRPPTLWVVVGFMSLFAISILYVCWFCIHRIVNRIIMGTWQ